MKKTFFLSLLLGLAISCQKDSIAPPPSKHSLALSSRTAISPGSFSVNSDGILEFPTIADFHQTIDYIITDSIETQLQSFRASFSLTTLNKQADHVIDSVEAFFTYPSQVSIYWPNYNHYISEVITSGDTILVPRFGTWGEFLNLQNLVLIEGSLYKITEDKTIIIEDGDLDKLDDAEELEVSDTVNGIFITPRACACDPTGFEWKKEATVYEYYNGNDHKVYSREIFSNFTLWKRVLPLSSWKVKVFPFFAHRTYVKIQKKGLVWFCHRMNFDWHRQVWVTHNLQLPTSCPNCSTSNLWLESTGWRHYECEFEWNQEYPYPTYITNRTWDMPGGYCLAVKIFSQSFDAVDNPQIENSWYYYPYPFQNMSGYYENNCSNFEWLYPL